MENQRTAEAEIGTSTTASGICDECGKIDVLTSRIDPESPLSGTLRLCPACVETPEPFWHDDR
jgi:hypothetical protein